jgi:hypothetical protein
MIDKQDQADSLDVVLGDGTPAPPGRSIFDARPEPPPEPWQPPTDEQHAHMQAAIGDVYARWAAGISENPPEPQGASEFGTDGEYPAFSYLFDADPEKRDALRDEVLNVVRSDAGGA